MQMRYLHWILCRIALFSSRAYSDLCSQSKSGEHTSESSCLIESNIVQEFRSRIYNNKGCIGGEI
jgi:hypothetical protein